MRNFLILMFVYLIRCTDNNYYKIGITKNIERRLKQIQTSSPDIIYLVDKYESKFSSKIETGLHNYFKPYRRNNEWFELGVEDEIKFREYCVKIEENLIILENKD